MAPRSKHQKAASSGSESDSDAPEAVSLSQSKKTIQKLDRSRENAIQAGRQSQRLRNQQRDKALKERAEKNKEIITEKRTGKGKGKEKEKEEQLDHDEEEEGSEVSEEEDGDEDLVDGDHNGLEARMLRAMKEAQDEQSGSDDDDDVDEEFEGFGGVHLSEDEESGDEDEDSDAPSLENDGDDDDDEEEEEGEEDGESDSADDDDDDDDEKEALPPPKKSQKIKFNPDHLPDEIFEAAFASQSTKRTFNDSDTDGPTTINSSRLSKKRKSNAKSDTPKDVVIVSRAIRVLPTSDHPKTPSTMPSRKVKKFMDRTLGLKAGKQRGKGWERRPVNVGVLRRAGGPAANFVRQQA